MSVLKSIGRQLIPHGLIERRRRRFRLQRMGLFPKPSEYVTYESAVNTCRFDLWPPSIKTGDWTLVDIGANQGDFILAVTRLATPAAVIAFEPEPSCAAILGRLLKNIPDSTLHQAAVGSKAGEVQLNCTRNNRMSSVLCPQPGIENHYPKDDYRVSTSITVPLVRLDDFIPPNTRIGLLKVDVQGYELEVLRGGSRSLQQTEALLIELNYTPHYEGAASFEEVHEFLRSSGFRVHGISAPYIDDRRPLWADAIYVRTGN